MGPFAIVLSLITFTGVRSSMPIDFFNHDPFQLWHPHYPYPFDPSDDYDLEVNLEEGTCAAKIREELVEIKKEVQSLTALVDGFLQKPDPDPKTKSSVEKRDDVTKTDIPKCPSGFEYLEQSRSCYKVIFERYDKNSAIIQCKQLNSDSHLVSIATHNESDALKNYLKRQLLRSSAVRKCGRHGWGYPETAFWTSAQRVNASDCSSEFVWNEGAGDEIPFAFTNWSTEEPNCYQGDEYCMEIIPRHGSTWNDVACRVASCPICEFDPQSIEAD